MVIAGCREPHVIKHHWLPLVLHSSFILFDSFNVGYRLNLEAKPAILQWTCGSLSFCKFVHLGVTSAMKSRLESDSNLCEINLEEATVTPGKDILAMLTLNARCIRDFFI